MRALGAAGEKHVEAELGDGLELALRGRVINGDVGVVEKAEQRGAVTLVVPDGGGQRLGRQESRRDGVEPAAEALHDRRDAALSVRAELGADEAAGLGVLFGDVHRGDEGATLGGEVGARGLGVAELAAAVRVASGLEDAAGRVDSVEAVFGVRWGTAPR